MGLSRGLHRVFSGMAFALFSALTAVPAPSHAQDLRLSLDGGPASWQVTGIGRNEVVALRKLPGGIFEQTGTVAYGETVRNIGCTEFLNDLWCRVQKQSGNRATGFIRQRYLTEVVTRPVDPTPEDSLAGGPDYWEVYRLKRGDKLNIRSSPDPQARLLGTLNEGDRVRNFGCQRVGKTRWCNIGTGRGSKPSGYVNGYYLREASGPAPRPPKPDDNLAGGPDFWRVRGLAEGDTLNVRQAPSARSPILATLSEGERVRNLGCEMSGQTRWCLIRSTTGMDVTGYVNGRYLRE